MYFFIFTLVISYIFALVVYLYHLSRTRCSKLEELSNQYYDEILKNLNEYGYHPKQIKRIRTTHDMFLRLKERRKHLPLKYNTFLYKDWFDYTSAWRVVKSAHDIFCVDSTPNSYEIYEKSVNKSLIEIEEIEQRFSKLLCNTK